MMAAIFTLATTSGFAASPDSERIEASYVEAGHTITIALTVYNYSTPSELQALSQAFQQGQDRALATELSKTKAVGRCLITGESSYDVAFIQTVKTPTGRQVTFITSRLHPLDEADPPGPPQSFDLAVGRFDLNDTDPTKSTGFLFPASKLVIGDQGAFHYDLAGNPWALVNVLDLNRAGSLSEPKVADAADPDPGKISRQPKSTEQNYTALKLPIR
jgi:hypothetical protein